MSAHRSAARALVTGASSGLGAALSRQLAARGIEVWLAARRAAELEAEVAKIRAAGGRAHALALDVSDAQRTVEILEHLDDEVGGFDLVVANAGVGSGGKTISEESWAESFNIMQVNFVGAAATLLPFIPRMRARGGGHLVGVSSIQADVAMPRGVSYGAAKAGFSFLLEGADLELRARGIDVTIVHPGFVRTPMTDKLKERMPFLVEVEDAAALIDRGIERRARMIRFPWITGALARFARSLPRALSRPLLRRAARVHVLPPARRPGKS